MMRHALLVLICVAGIFPGALHAELKVGDSFPDLATAGLVGTLPERSGKIVLVDFWASWCAPCKESFPFYSRLQQEYAARGVVIIGVGVDETAPAFAAFLKKLNPGFAAVHDREQKLVRAVTVPTMPTSYLLDRAGRVRAIHDGYRGAATERAVRQEIETLLAETK